MIKKLKKLILISLMAGFLGGIIYAQGVSEQLPGNSSPAGEIVEARLAVLKGPSGFGFVKVLDEALDSDDGLVLETSVLASPTEVIARFSSGEVDFAVLPVNVAALIFNKGIPCKLIAVTGDGMLSLLSTDPELHDTIKSISEKEIAVPGQGSTPDLVTRFILSSIPKKLAENTDEIKYNYTISAPAQLAQMMIAGKVSTAVLPEPFATMVKMKKPDARSIIDIQSTWKEITGTGVFPMTALLVREEFFLGNRNAVETLLVSVEESIDWVLTHKEQASLLIEEQGILTAAMALPSIDACNLVFGDALEEQARIETYLKVLLEYAPASIGGKLPYEAFYMER